MSTPKEFKIVRASRPAFTRTCLIVAGMHRSGTSALARAANLLGYSAPKNVLGAEEFNEAGHWEPERIVAVHDELLMLCDSQWDDWRPLNLGDLSVRQRREFGQRLRTLLKEEFENSETFVLKDPRLCRFLPFYQDILKSYHIEDIYALPFRNPLEVCDSLARRDGISRSFASLVWLRHVVDSEFFSRGRPRGFCSYDDFLSNVSATLEKLSVDTGTLWPHPLPKVGSLLKQHVRTDLQHHTADLDELNASEEINDWVRTAYWALLELKQDPNHQGAMTRLDSVRAALNEAAATVGTPTFSELLRRKDKAIFSLEEMKRQVADLQANLMAEQSNISRLLNQHDVLILEKEAAAERVVADLREALDAEQLERSKIQAERDMLSAELGALDARFAKTASTMLVLSSELADAKSALEKSTAQIYGLNVDLDKAEKALCVAQEQNIKQAADLSEALSFVSQRDIEIALVRDQTNDLKNALERAIESAAAWERRFTEQHSAHSRDIEQIVSSTSWRITRPIRGFKRMLVEPGFARSLLQSTARALFFAIPLGNKTRQRLLKAYHDHRLRNTVLSVPPPIKPAPASERFTSMAMMTDQDEPNRSSALMVPLEVPPDGRWNIQEYNARQSEIATYLAALSRPNESGPVWESDVQPSVVNEGPLVSIIVRSYAGRWPLLRTALESVGLQNYRPIELIVVEDRTETLRDETLGLDFGSGVTLRYLSSPNGGRSLAANVGLDAASGEYIGFLDDDDYLMPDHCSRLVGLLEARPELAATYSAAMELSANLDRTTMSFSDVRENAVFMTALANSNELLHRNGFPIQAVIFRAKICNRSDRFNAKLDALEDWLFWLRMLVGQPIAAISHITSAFYIPGSRADHRRRMESHLAAEPFFAIQRNAFYEERRLTNIEPVDAQIHQQRKSALERAALVPIEGSRPTATVNDTPLSRALGLDPAPTLLPKLGPKIVAYTSINLRYLPKALAWARSVKVHNPEWETHILLNDAVPPDAHTWPDVDVVYPICKLGIPNFHGWAYMMRVVELCTATKPFYAKTLLKAGFDYVFYFDPDTHAYSDLNALIDEFGEDEVLITPHCSEEADTDAEIHFSEMSSLAHGVYNLGFLGLKQSETGHKVADFWCRRLLRHCADDHGRGLFTDQKWFNLVPVFFEKVKTLKHKGCNTASWNIAKRPITRESGQWLAGGAPLIFFHFSGYDRNVPRAMFDVFGSFNEDLASLIDEYDKTNERFGKLFPVWKSEWAFSRYDNGQTILDAHREIYRSEYQCQLAYPTPFFAGRCSFLANLEQLGEAVVEAKVAPPGFIRRYF